MKKLLYILFCITLIFCNSKTEEIKEEVIVFSDNGTTIYESDIYEVINTFFEDQKETNILDGIDYNGELLTVYPNSYYSFSKLYGYLEITQSEDIDFMNKQIVSLDKYDLKQECFSNFKLIPIDTMNVLRDYIIKQEKRDWNEISKKFKNQFQSDTFYAITIPLFSLDKKTAIISFESQYFPGGNGGFHLYRKENDKWIRTNKGFTSI